MANTAHCSLSSENLESHLRRLSARERKGYVTTHKRTLHEKVAEAAQNGNKLLLELLLGMFSGEDRFTILKRQCKNGKLPIHHCLSGKQDCHIQALKYLLSCVPKEHLYSLVTAYSSMYYNCLHMAAKHNNVEAATLIVSAVPRDKQFALITQVGGSTRRTVLEFDINDDFRVKIQKFIVDGPEEIDLQASASADIFDEDILIAWPANLNDSAEIVLGYCDQCHTQSRSKISRRGSRVRERPHRRKCTNASDLLYVDTGSALRRIDQFLTFVSVSGTTKLIMDCRNMRGLTILHIAAKDNRVDIIRKIFKAIENFSGNMKWNLLTSISNSGKTPLHYAAQYNSVEALKLLLFHAGDRDHELCKIEDSVQRNVVSYAPRETKIFLDLVETHYWHTFSRPPTVLIFYNRYSGEGEWERGYGETEKEHVVSGFKSQGIEPLTYEGFDGRSIVQTIRHLEDKEHPVSAMVVLVMTHGGEGFVFDKHKRQLPIDSLVPALCTDKLKGIPKVLMIQACRTREDQASSPGSVHPLADPQPPGSSRRQVVRNSTENRLSLTKHQQNPHFCIIYTTLVGRLAYQDYFLKIFSDVISEKANQPPDDLLSINTMVSSRMRHQTSVLVTSLKRKLVFRDPLRRSFSLLERLQQTFSMGGTSANCYKPTL